MVTTKATAPGGARTEKVGLPFDPDLFDHMLEHGVVIEVCSVNEQHRIGPLSDFICCKHPFRLGALQRSFF